MEYDKLLAQLLYCTSSRLDLHRESPLGGASNGLPWIKFNVQWCHQWVLYALVCSA